MAGGIETNYCGREFCWPTFREYNFLNKTVTLQTPPADRGRHLK